MPYFHDKASSDQQTINVVDTIEFVREGKWANGSI